MSKSEDNKYLLWPYVVSCKPKAKREDVKTLCWVSEYDVLIIFTNGEMFIYDTFLGMYRKIKYEKPELTKQEFSFEFGRRLHDLIQRKYMTTNYFAQQMGLSISAVSRYTKGKCVPNAYTMNKMLNILEVKADQLLLIPIILQKYLKEEEKNV